MSRMNRLGNALNPYQGQAKKVLCLCSAGLLRSPTAAVVLSQPPFNFNTRAAGVSREYALIPVDEVLLHWADEIVCMQQEHADEIKSRTDKPIKVLHIEDRYPYGDAMLMAKIADRYHQTDTRVEKETSP